MKADKPKITEVNPDKQHRHSSFTDDKLSWQNIMLTEQRWANTEDSWKSILILIVAAFVAVFAISLVLNLLVG